MPGGELLATLPQALDVLLFVAQDMNEYLSN